MHGTTNPPSAYKLEQAFSALQSAHARIAQGEGYDADTGEIVDIEALQGDAEALLHATLRAAVHAKDMADAADARAKAIMERRDRFRRRYDELRGAAFAAMDVLELKRVQLPDLTATVAAGVASVQITDESALPADYLRTTITPDKTKIGADLKQGVVIPGAELSNPMPQIRIKAT